MDVDEPTLPFDSRKKPVKILPQYRLSDIDEDKIEYLDRLELEEGEVAPIPDGVVLSTFNESSGRHNRRWERIILDEAHLAKRRNGTVESWISQERFNSIHFVTATPMVHSAKDLSTFLRIIWSGDEWEWSPPFDELGDLELLYDPEYDPHAIEYSTSERKIKGIFHPENQSSCQAIIEAYNNNHIQLWISHPDLYKHTGALHS